MRTYTQYLKIYIGGWYCLRNPFNYVPMTISKIIVIDMFNVHLN